MRQDSEPAPQPFRIGSIIQHHGLAVMGGFIIGFDSDPPDIFQRQVNFIQKNGIVTAMIGLLTAIPGTRLYNGWKKKAACCLRHRATIRMPSGSLNFIPKMDRQTIIDGYKWVMNTIYSPEMYYKRILAFLHQYQPEAVTIRESAGSPHSCPFALVSGTRRQGLAESYYWRLLKDGLSKIARNVTDGCGDHVHLRLPLSQAVLVSPHSSEMGRLVGRPVPPRGVKACSPESAKSVRCRPRLRKFSLRCGQQLPQRLPLASRSTISAHDLNLLKKARKRAISICFCVK